MEEILDNVDSHCKYRSNDTARFDYLQSLCREACMGPLRSLYECEGELEKVITQRPTGTLSIIRPVHMSDCGKVQPIEIYYF